MKRRDFIAAAALPAVWSCMPATDPSISPAPFRTSISPHLRVGLSLGATRPTFSGTGGLRVIDPERGELASHSESAQTEARLNNAMITVGQISLPMLVLAPSDPAGGVRWNGCSYPGTIELRPGRDGIMVVNRITVEEYLVGVVRAEMGVRPEGEHAALEAQAVAARTYALRNMAGGGDRGYDLLSTVDHQVYNGISDVDPGAAAAVRSTRGEAVVWEGQPIDAFYSSTCGGHSEDGVAVFPGADRSYLIAKPDTGPGNRAWCSGSPTFRWEERWSAREIVSALQRTLPAERLTAAVGKTLNDIKVRKRSRSGRMAEIDIIGDRGTAKATGGAIRRVLSPTRGGLLRSTDFVVRIERRGGRLASLNIEGKGYGHGVGMCQWGAIGRAGAGQGYRSILMHYFPGTTIERLY